MSVWRRKNVGWAVRPIWILDEEPKAILRRIPAYETYFNLIVCFDEEEMTYRLNAPSLKQAKIVALEMYKDIVIGSKKNV